MTLCSGFKVRSFHRVAALLALACVANLAVVARAEELLEAKATEKSGVGIQLPKGWQADEHADSRTLLLARAPARDKDKAGEFQTLLTIASDVGTKIDGSAQQARVAKERTNYKTEEEPTPVTINGLEGVRFGGTLTVSSLKLRTRQYMVLHDNHIYTLTFMALESHWAAYAAVIDASAASFHIVTK